MAIDAIKDAASQSIAATKFLDAIVAGKERYTGEWTQRKKLGGAVREALQAVYKIAKELLETSGPEECRKGKGDITQTDTFLRVDSFKYVAQVHRDPPNEKGVAISMWMPLRTIESWPLLVADSRWLGKKYVTRFWTDSQNIILVGNFRRNSVGAKMWRCTTRD